MSELAQVESVDAARRALAQADNVARVKSVIDRAEVVRAYARKLQRPDWLAWAEFKVDAARRAGQMLAILERGKTGPAPQFPDGSPIELGESCSPNSEYRQALEAAHINVRVGQNWQLIGRIPDDAYQTWKDQLHDQERPVTERGAVEFARRLFNEPAPQVPVPPGTYRAITLDPPWPIEKIERLERTNQEDLDYQTMSLDEIGALPVHDLADEAGCHVYLWVTHRFLPDGLDLLARWGARYQCVMTWVKNVGITPFSWMYSTEHVLFGRIGSLPLERNGLRLDFAAPVQGHSRKPDVFYERVCQASPGPRLAMFERGQRDGFEVWGDEVIADAG
jgi:N6-adenosine-specific RNA methylase IME4